MKIVIPVGKGTISIDEKISKTISGKYLVISSVLEQGPCQDGMCQIIKDTDVSIRDEFSHPEYLFFEGGALKIAIDPDVYRSIDKGRENITIVKGISGKFQIRGFAYLN